MIRTLFELPGLPSIELPPELRRAFDGNLGFAMPVLYLNFVTSADGVAAFHDGTPPSAISGSASDRLVMGLLRAFADTVLIGASTLRAEPDHLWSPEFVCPTMAEPFLELRRRLELGSPPRLVVLTRSGELDPSARALQLGALVLTTDAGAATLAGRLPGSCVVRSLGGDVTIAAALEVLHAAGARSILSEGGPSVAAQLLKADAVDELFLTISPRIFGRTGPDRLSVVEGLSLQPGEPRKLSLAGVKCDAGELYLRYRLRG